MIRHRRDRRVNNPGIYELSHTGRPSRVDHRQSHLCLRRRVRRADVEDTLHSRDRVNEAGRFRQVADNRFGGAVTPRYPALSSLRTYARTSTPRWVSSRSTQWGWRPVAPTITTRIVGLLPEAPMDQLLRVRPRPDVIARLKTG